MIKCYSSALVVYIAVFISALHHAEGPQFKPEQVQEFRDYVFVSKRHAFLYYRFMISHIGVFYYSYNLK